MPERIQLKRTKGWRKPEGAIVVSRPSKWGNPYKVGTPFTDGPGEITPRLAVTLFHMEVMGKLEGGTITVGFVEALSELRGHDLACWCPLDQPCHADVLLEVANV